MSTTPPETIRILLADDHALFCDGLAMQLTKADPCLKIVGQVLRGADVLPAVLQLAPHLVLVDINLPAPNGIACVRQLTAEFPGVKAIMLTMYDYHRFQQEAREAGAAGYLLKHIRVSAIVDAIYRVMAGTNIFPDTAISDQSGNHPGNRLTEQYKLTPTEIKVITLIRQGLSSTQIGEQLFVGYETVKSHRKNIYRKLNINHLSGLLEFARIHHL